MSSGTGHNPAPADSCRALGSLTSFGSLVLLFESESQGETPPRTTPPLTELRATITMTALQEYVPRGETPQKVQCQYHTKPPRIEHHETILAAFCRPKSASFSASPRKTPPVIFSDIPIQPTTDRDVSSAYIGDMTWTVTTGDIEKEQRREAQRIQREAEMDRV